MYVIQDKNGTMVNVDLNVKSQLNGVFVKKDYLWITSTCDCECDKKSGIGED